MMIFLIRFIYNLLFIIILPFIFLKNLWRSRLSPGYRKRNLERLGFAPFKKDELEKPIWVHSVSMGETIAISPLVKKLIAYYPEKQFLITTMSVTGSNQVKQIYQDFPQVKHCYLPYDISICLHIFLRKIKPQVLIIMETEIWPNLLYLCHKKKIPTMLTNARLSEKSAKGYKKINFLSKPLFNWINQIAVQNKTDAKRFLDTGFKKEKLFVTGNLKFDVSIPEETKLKGAELKKSLGDKLTWIAASTHQGEDEIILKAHQKIIEKFPNSLLMLVPRHPERFDSVFRLANEKFISIRRSEKTIPNEKTQVYLGDTMGEMMTFFQASDVAFIGGSLINHGGHNLLEPALFKLPVLSGKHTFNFAEITQQLINENGLLMINNETELTKKITKLFSDETLRHKMGNNAYRVVKNNQGALNRQFKLVTKLIDHSL